VRGVEQGLGRDTSAVQANAAERFILLDQDYFFAEVSQTRKKLPAAYRGGPVLKRIRFTGSNKGLYLRLAHFMAFVTQPKVPSMKRGPSPPPDNRPRVDRSSITAIARGARLDSSLDVLAEQGHSVFNENGW